MNRRAIGLRCCRLAWLSLLATLLTPSVRAADADFDEYRVKSAFLFNFSKFVTWPKSAMEEAPVFGIAVPRGSKFLPELKKLEMKRIKGRSVRIRTYDSLLGVPACHVLVVGNAEFRRLSVTDRRRLERRHLLTVGEEGGFARAGGMLELLLVDEHLAFRLNLPVARRAGLELSANLIKLALPPERKGGR